MAQTKITSEEGLVKLLTVLVQRTPKAQRQELWGWLAEIFGQPDPSTWGTQRTVKPVDPLFHIPVDARRNNGRRRANSGAVTEPPKG